MDEMEWVSGDRNRRQGWTDLHGLGGRGFRGSSESFRTYIRPFLLVWTLENVPQDVDARFGFDGDAGLHAQLVDVAYQFARRGRTSGGVVGGLGGCDRSDGRFVVEAVEVAAGVAEGGGPAVRLERRVRLTCSKIARRWGKRGRIEWDRDRERRDKTERESKSRLERWCSDRDRPG